MAPKTQTVYQMKADVQGNLLIEFFWKISWEKFEKLDVEKPVFSRGCEIIVPLVLKGLTREKKKLISTETTNMYYSAQYLFSPFLGKC